MSVRESAGAAAACGSMGAREAADVAVVTRDPMGALESAGVAVACGSMAARCAGAAGMRCSAVFVGTERCVSSGSVITHTSGADGFSESSARVRTPAEVVFTIFACCPEATVESTGADVARGSMSARESAGAAAASKGAPSTEDADDSWESAGAAAASTSALSTEGADGLREAVSAAAASKDAPLTGVASGARGVEAAGITGIPAGARRRRRCGGRRAYRPESARRTRPPAS